MPWEVPITVDGMRYPVRFNTENEPTQDEIDEAVQQITNQAQPASEKPFWKTGDVLSALGDVATNVLPATWAGVRRGWEGIQKEHSPEYMEAMAADEARNRAVLDENARREAAGELSTAGENIREIVPSLGFMGASIPSTMAGARTGAFTGGRAATMAGAPEFAPQAALAGGVIGGFAGGFGASYRMMGAQFMDDAMNHFNELSMQKLKRPLNDAERQKIYDDLLPVAQNTALWEAAPEAIGNLATLGAGKVILGIGKPAFQALVKGAKAKILAGVGSQATELATEGITEFGQGNDQAKLEAYKAGLPMESVAPKYQGAQGLWEATKEVAPAVATLGALTAGAGGLAYGANKALSKAPTELSQAQVEALTARSLASAQADMDEAKSSDEGWMAKNNAIAKAAYKLQNAQKAAEYVAKGQFDEAATMFGGKLTAPNTIVQDQLNASMAGVAANADVAPQTAAVDEQAQNEPIIPTPAGSPVSGDTETEEISGIGAINRADIAGVSEAEPPVANEPPSPESLVGDAGEVIPITEESSLVAPEDEAFAAQRRADLLAGAADAASGKVKTPVSPVVTAMVTPQPQTTQTNALQKQSTGSVLQREQKEARKTGSERERVEPSLEGQEAAGARQEGEEIITPQGKPTTATEGKVMPGGSAVERDLMKPYANIAVPDLEKLSTKDWGRRRDYLEGKLRNNQQEKTELLKTPKQNWESREYNENAKINEVAASLRAAIQDMQLARPDLEAEFRANGELRRESETLQRVSEQPQVSAKLGDTTSGGGEVQPDNRIIDVPLLDAPPDVVLESWNQNVSPPNSLYQVGIISIRDIGTREPQFSTAKTIAGARPKTGTFRDYIIRKQGWIAGRYLKAGKRPSKIYAEAVDSNKIELPSGYVKQGDLYVFQPETAASPTAPNITAVEVIPEDYARAKANAEKGGTGWGAVETNEQPIKAYRKPDGQLKMYDGHHRLVNAQQKGKKTIPVSIDGEGVVDVPLSAFQIEQYGRPDLKKEVSQTTAAEKKPSGIAPPAIIPKAEGGFSKEPLATEERKQAVIGYAKALLGQFPSLSDVEIISPNSQDELISTVENIHGKRDEDVRNGIYEGEWLPEKRIIIIPADARPSTIAHEVGHAVLDEYWANTDEATKKAIQAEHAAWAKKSYGKPTVADSLGSWQLWDQNRFPDLGAIRKHPKGLSAEVRKSTEDYRTSFLEWAADQFSYWSQTKEQPKSLVDKFFADLSAQLAKIWDAVKQHFAPNATYANWIESLLKPQHAAEIVPARSMEVSGVANTGELAVDTNTAPFAIKEWQPWRDAAGDFWVSKILTGDVVIRKNNGRFYVKGVYGAPSKGFSTLPEAQVWAKEQINSGRHYIPQDGPVYNALRLFNIGARRSESIIITRNRLKGESGMHVVKPDDIQFTDRQEILPPYSDYTLREILVVSQDGRTAKSFVSSEREVGNFPSVDISGQGDKIKHVITIDNNHIGGGRRGLTITVYSPSTVSIENGSTRQAHLLKPTTAAENQTAASSAKEAAAAGVVQSETGKGSILPDDETKETPYKEESRVNFTGSNPQKAEQIIEYLDQLAKGGRATAYSAEEEKDVTVITPGATKAEIEKRLNEITKGDDALVKEIASQLGVKPTAKAIAEDIHNEAAKARNNLLQTYQETIQGSSLEAGDKVSWFDEKDRQLYGVIKKITNGIATIARGEKAQEKGLLEVPVGILKLDTQDAVASRRKSLDSIIGKPQEVEMNAVSVGDGRESLAMVHNSGDVPGVLNAFVGTSKDFLANPENEKNFPGLYRLLKGGQVDEGNFAYGRAFVFTDGIGINAVDRANAVKLGVTPAVAAVRRVLIHESLVHRGIFGLPAHLQRKILQWVQQNTTPEQLDVLAKTYPRYADWRLNENQLLALCEEFLAKKVEKLTTISKSGPLARLMDILSDIWRWITGNTGEPTIKNLKDVVKLLKAGAEAAGAEAADARLVNGGKIKMSQLRAQGFVTPEMDKAYMDAVNAGDMEKAQWLAYESYQASQSEMTAKNYLAIIDRKREYENLVDNLEQAYNRALKGDDTKEQDVGSYFGPQLVGKDELHQSLSAIAKTPEEIVELLWRQYASGVRPMPTTRDYLAYMQNVGIIPYKMDNAWDFINSDEADNIKNRVAVEAQKWLNLSREDKVPTINPKTDPVYQQVINDWLARNPKSAQTLRDLVGSKGELIKLDARGMPMAGAGRFDHKGVLAVTRDDAGNVIPLSQRFNAASPDIRASRISYANPIDAQLANAAERMRAMREREATPPVPKALARLFDTNAQPTGTANKLFQTAETQREEEVTPLDNIKRIVSESVSRSEVESLLKDLNTEEIKEVVRSIGYPTQGTKADNIRRILSFVGSRADAIAIRGINPINLNAPTIVRTPEQQAAFDEELRLAKERANELDINLPQKKPLYDQEKWNRNMAAIMAPSSVAPQKIRNEIRAAYDRAMVGESSIQVPIQKVFDEAKSAIPSLTERDFGKQLQNLYEDGSAFLVPTDHSADMIAAGEKWGVYDAAGMPASYVGLMPVQESPIIYATPIDRNAIQTQVEESAKAPINEDSLKGFLLRAIAMHGQPSSVRMARLDPDAPLQVSAQPNGELIIGLGVRQAGEVIRNSRSTQAGFKYLADAVEEEMIHFADLLAMRSKWEAQGKQIDFDHFIRRQSMELTMDLMQTAETLSIADKEALRKVLAANLASYSNNPNWNNDTLENVIQAYAESPMKMNAELVRSLIQAKRSGEITATGYQRIANTIVKWLQDALNWLKQSYNQARGGTFGNVLARRIQEVEGQLDALGAPANIKASRISNDVDTAIHSTRGMKGKVDNIIKELPANSFTGKPLQDAVSQSFAPLGSDQFYADIKPIVIKSLDDMVKRGVDDGNLLETILDPRFAIDNFKGWNPAATAVVSNIFFAEALNRAVKKQDQLLADGDIVGYNLQQQKIDAWSKYNFSDRNEWGVIGNAIQKVMNDPEYQGLYLLSNFRSQKIKQEQEVTDSSMKDPVKAADEIDKAGKDSKGDADEAVSDAAEELSLEDLIRDGEASLSDAEKSLWQRAKEYMIHLGAIAKAEIQAAFTGKASNAISASDLVKHYIAMPKDKRDKEKARFKKELNDVLGKLIGDKTTAKGKKKGDLVEAFEKKRSRESIKDKVFGPDEQKAFKALIRKLNAARPGETTPLARVSSWKALFEMTPTDQGMMKGRMFDTIKNDPAFDNLTPEEQQKLATLLEKAWDKRREQFLTRELDRIIRTQNMSKKAAKALEQRPAILRKIDSGVFDYENLAALVGEQYGIKNLTPQEAKRVKEISSELGQDLMPHQRTKLQDELQELMVSKNLSLGEMLKAWWITAVLTGPRTAFTIGLSFMTGGFELVGHSMSVLANPKMSMQEKSAAISDAIKNWWGSIGREAKAAWMFVLTGDKTIQDPSSLMSPQFFDKQFRGNMGRFSFSAAEKMIKSTNPVIRYMGWFMTYAGRILNALDTFNYGITKAGSAPLVYSMLKNAYKPGQMSTSKLVREAKNEIIQKGFNGEAPNASTLNAWARNLAYAKLETITGMAENMNQVAKQGNFTLEPTGFGGLIYNALKHTDAFVQRWAEERVNRMRKDMLKGDNYWIEQRLFNVAEFVQAGLMQVLPILGLQFAKFATNSLNQTISFIPIAGLGRLKEQVDGQAVHNKMIWRNQAIGSAAFMWIYITLKAIEQEPDDEKRGWGIEGDWSNLTPQEKRQRDATGLKENTIWWRNKDGKRVVLNYVNWPVRPLLAAFGSMSDQIKYAPDQWQKGGVMKRGVTTGWAMAKSVLNTSAVSQFTELFGSNIASRDPVEAFTNKAARVFGGYAGGFVPRIIKDIDRWMQPEINKYEGWEYLGKELPFYRRSIGHEYLDVFGKVIAPSQAAWSREMVQQPMEPEYRMLGRLNSRGLWLTPAVAENRLVGKGSHKRPMTDEEAQRYVKAVGQGYREMILRYGDRLLSMPKDRAKDFLAAKSDDVRDRSVKLATRPQ